MLTIPSLAIDRFVAPSGSDAGDCTGSQSPCQTILYTMGQAANGDTIDIGPGIYTEADIALDKSLNLQGDGMNSTIIQAHGRINSASGRVFTVAANVSVTIEKITIRHGNTIASPNASPGGGIFNQGDLNLRNCRVSGNRTGNGMNGGNGGSGGGIYNAENASLTLIESTISENVTGGGSASSEASLGTGGPGGGIYNAGSITLITSTISNNLTGSGFAGNPTGTSGGHGGGIYNADTGTMALNTCTVSNNATGFGGSFASGGKGGGIFNQGTSILIHTTLSDNQAGQGGAGGQDGNGGGIFTDNATLVISTTLIAGNTVPLNGNGPDCFGNLDSKGFNLIESTRDCTRVATDNPDTDILNVAPKLSSRAGDNGGTTSTHSLLQNSPAIDAGDPNFSSPPGPEFDQRGEPRVIGGRIDIGAFEFLEPEPFNLTLNRGWNLISIPLITSESTDQIFGNSKKGNVWKWNVTNQRLEVATTLETGLGYWVYSENGTETPIIIIGSGIGPTDIPLDPEENEKWYLIGPSKVPPFNDDPIDFSVLNPSNSFSNPIWTWDHLTFTVADFFQLGKGYWVFQN